MDKVQGPMFALQEMYHKCVDNYEDLNGPKTPGDGRFTSGICVVQHAAL